jgi:hypothetical protein
LDFFTQLLSAPEITAKVEKHMAAKKKGSN